MILSDAAVALTGDYCSTAVSDMFAKLQQTECFLFYLDMLKCDTKSFIKFSQSGACVSDIMLIFDK